MRRRLSGILALVALAHLSLGGVVPGCTPVAETARHADHDNPPTPVVTAHQSHGSSCAADDAEYGTSGDAGCAVMASCAMALTAWSRAAAAEGPLPHRVATAVLDAPLDPARTPEPPPPRA